MHVVIKDPLKKQINEPKDEDEDRSVSHDPPYSSPGCTRMKKLPTLEDLDRRKR